MPPQKSACGLYQRVFADGGAGSHAAIAQAGQKMGLTSGSDAPDFAGISRETARGGIRSTLRDHDAQMKTRTPSDVRVRKEASTRSRRLARQPSCSAEAHAGSRVARMVARRVASPAC
jgi:hypothetical protein